MDVIQERVSIYMPTQNKEGVKAAAIYFSTLRKQRLLRMAFPGGEVKTPAHFAEAIFDDGTLPFFIYTNKPNMPTFIGHLFLSNWTGNAAVGHFGFVRDVWGETGYYGREALRRVEELACVDTIIGFTDVRNKLALRLVHECGFEQMCVVPKAFSRNGKPVDAVFSCLTFPLSYI